MVGIVTTVTGMGCESCSQVSRLRQTKPLIFFRLNRSRHDPLKLGLAMTNVDQRLFGSTRKEQPSSKLEHGTHLATPSPQQQV